MQKIIISTILFIGVTLSSGQVCNPAGTQRPGQFLLGIAPVIYVEQGKDVGLLLQGGVGITRSIDLALKVILNNNHTYFGGDFEFTILSGMPIVSLAAGMHAHSTIGTDATLNITFPIRGIVALYGGLDSDIDFYRGATLFPLWGFFGLQVVARKHLGLFMEADIGITNPAPHMLDFGINIYF